MTHWLHTDEGEILDREGASERGKRILDDLDRWNRWIGWYGFHVRRVQDHWRALARPEPVRILDVGTGPGGLLEAVACRFDAAGVHTELVGVDLNPAYVRMARERLGGRATILQADATQLPYEENAFDIATTTLMMHHLPLDVRRRMVAELGRVCRSAYIFDLRVSLYGLLGWALLTTLFRLGADTRHDGMVSVRKACTYSEFKDLVAPLPVRASRVFPSAMCTRPA